MGYWESNGSLGDNVRERDGYQQSRRVRIGIEVRCVIALEEAWTGACPWFLEEDRERFMGMTFLGTDGEVKVGTLRGGVRPGLFSMQGGSETMGVRPGFVHTGTPGQE